MIEGELDRFSWSYFNLRGEDKVIAFTPTFTFATPGNLSNVYTVQIGYGVAIGNVFWFTMRLAWTPTHTNASGEARFAGFPFNALDVTDLTDTFALRNTGVNLDWGAGITMLAGGIAGGQNYVRLIGSGSGVASATLDTAAFPTGQAQTLQMSGAYLI